MLLCTCAYCWAGGHLKTAVLLHLVYEIPRRIAGRADAVNRAHHFYARGVHNTAALWGSIGIKTACRYA